MGVTGGGAGLGGKVRFSYSYASGDVRSSVKYTNQEFGGEVKNGDENLGSLTAAKDMREPILLY